MPEKIRNLLFYVGVTQEDYETVEFRVDRANRIITTVVAGLATVLIGIMYISSLSVTGVEANRFVYGIGTILSAILFLSSLLLAKNNDKLVTPLVMASISIFYIYGILIGCVTSPEEKTVTFIVMLVFLPTLFIDRPIHITAISVMYVTIFIIACYNTKTGVVLDNDVIDAIVFGVLGITNGVVVNHMKIRGYVSEEELRQANEKLDILNQQLSHISRTDTLTGAQNRTAYMLDLANIHALAHDCLGYIYIDADGLKIINDKLGHQAGDEMLKFIAAKIIEYFGTSLTYRIGGDEFVAFILDPGDYEIKTKTDKMIAEIEAKGYHVSVGWKIHQLDKLSIATLEREAEAFMYQKKAEFHREHPELNRRSSN